MRTLIKNANVFMPDESIEMANILIEGNTICEISKEDIPIPAQEYDLSGYTLIPGLIHSHVHLMECYDGFNEDKLKVWLQAGFTHLRDQGILSKHTAEDAVAFREKNRKSCMYPSITVCGNFISTPNGYGGANPIGVTTVNEAKDAVKRQIDMGVDHIKTVLDEGYDDYTASLSMLSQSLLEAICEEAHVHNRKVSAHVNRANRLKTLLDAGIDEAAHTCFDPIPEETLDYMVKHNVAMTPTLSIYGEISTNWGAPFIYTAMDNVKRFVQKGGIIGFGNDHIEEKPIWSPVGMPMMEIELLLKAGLTMQQIITSMTLGGAKIIGNEKIGRVEKGCLADLAAVKGNPIDFPYLLSNIQFVMKDGVVVKNR